MSEPVAPFERRLREAEERTRDANVRAEQSEHELARPEAEHAVAVGDEVSLELEHVALQLELAREEAERARAELHEARREAAETRSRMQVLLDAGAAMTASLEVRSVLGAATGAAARRICDYAVAFMLGRHGEVDRAVGAHRDPARFGMVERLAYAHLPERDSPDSLIAAVLRTGTPVMVERVPPELLERVMHPGEQLGLAHELGFASVIVVPLAARGRTLGALALVRDASSPPFGDDDFELARILAIRAALAVDNARLYEERDHVAETLRRSLLPPEFPRIPGIEIGARYLPAAEGQVGGDFVDVFPAGDRHWLAVIGDVIGKGVEAAAMMALARYTVRTVALSEGRPSAILDVLNQAVLTQTSHHRFCTACCARLLPTDDGVRVTVASGGHPLPLVLAADGSIRTAGVPGTILGVFEDATHADRVVELLAGDALVLYTDGVTDERDEHGAEFGEARLGETLAALAGAEAQQIADGVVDAVERFRTGRARDDIAVLVLRVTDARGPAPGGR